MPTVVEMAAKLAEDGEGQLAVNVATEIELMLGDAAELLTLH